MALSYLCGFEMGNAAECFAQTVGTGGSLSVQSTTKRSGTYALQAASSVLNPGRSFVEFAKRSAGGTLVSAFHSPRFWFRVGTLLNGDTIWGAGPQGFSTAVAFKQALSILPAGTIRILSDQSVGGNSADGTINVNDGQWHFIEADFGWNAGAGGKLYIDGTLDATVSTGTVAAQTSCHMGAGVIPGTGGGGTYQFDDVAFYDASLGGGLGSLPTVSLLLPTADSAVGNWRRNDGSTSTSLWDSVNNVPPTGTAVTSTLAATYVQNGTAGSSVANDNLDLTCAAYTSVTGLTTASQVLGVMPLCNDAQQVTTGSPKSAAVAVASNPAVSDQSFDLGLPNGTAGSTTAAAQGAFPTGWGTHAGAVVEAPSLTMASGPVVRVKRTGTYTRVISVDFAGVYVMWSPAVAAATSLPPAMTDRRIVRNSLLRR